MALAAPVAPAIQPMPAASGSRRATAPVRRPKLGPVGHSHHPRRAPQPMRLTRRGRLAGWATALVAVGIMAFGLTQAVQPMSPDVVGSRMVTVTPGQTLWGIASTVNPDVDPRVTVAAIRDANALPAPTVVRAGDTITVPVFGDR